MQFSITKEWAMAALTRAIKTMAQTALGMFTVGAAIQEINVLNILSVAVVAGIYSILTSIVTGVPEATFSGTLLLGAGGAISMELEDEKKFAELANGKKTATFKVDSPATRAEAVASGQPA